MPTPLTWDAPSLHWDTGTWDGVKANPFMNNTKANIDFTSYTAAELGPIAQNIHDKMNTNATTFSTPPITMTALQTLVTAYDTKLIARASRATADILAFNEQRDELESALAVLGHYVNSVAKGDPVIVEKSGFPSYETNRAADNSPPEAPTNLRLNHGDVSGAIRARYKPEAPGSANEVQTTTGDPNMEASWTQKGIFKGGTADLFGFTPGAVVWVRVRTVGNKGVMGAWSDPAQIRVL